MVDSILIIPQPVSYLGIFEYTFGTVSKCKKHVICKIPICSMDVFRKY